MNAVYIEPQEREMRIRANMTAKTDQEIHDILHRHVPSTTEEYVYALKEWTLRKDEGFSRRAKD